MSFDDDHCDFCGAYCDPIGASIARVVEEKLWCGWCRGGRDFLWGHVSTGDIILLRDQRQIDYNGSIKEKERYQNRSPEEENKLYLHVLNLSEEIANLKKVLHDRGLNPDTSFKDLDVT